MEFIIEFIIRTENPKSIQSQNSFSFLHQIQSLRTFWNRYEVLFWLIVIACGVFQLWNLDFVVDHSGRRWTVDFLEDFSHSLNLSLDRGIILRNFDIRILSGVLGFQFILRIKLWLRFEDNPIIFSLISSFWETQKSIDVSIHATCVSIHQC